MRVHPTYRLTGQGSLAGVPKKIYFDRGHITNLSDTLKGQQIGIVSAEGDTLKFVYDGSLVNQVSWSGTNGVNTVKGKVAFRYNSDQQVIAESVIPVAGSADSVNLQYDQDGLLTSIGLMKLKYGTSNTLLQSDTVGNIVTNYGYDTFGALSFKESKYGATTLYRVDYVRDSLSRIIEKTEIDQGGTTTYGYTYDVTGRLSQVSRNDTLVSVYSFDANGNRLAHWTPAQVDSGSYDTQDRLLYYSSTQDSTIQYFYTQNGDLTQTVKGTDTTRHSYDAFGSLRSVMLPEGTLIDYLIDGSGKRIGRKVNGAITQKWLYSSDLRIIAELDSANNIISRFVYTTSENVPEYFEKSDTIYRIITDHLGSVRQVVNASTGEIIQKIDYDEYGNVFFNSKPGFTPFGYAGGLYDEHTKLVRFGARDYDAITGRWTAKDPIAFEGGDGNLYKYCIDDPINSKDLTGKSLERWWEKTLKTFNLAQEETIGGVFRLIPAWLEAGKSLMLYKFTGTAPSGLEMITMGVGIFGGFYAAPALAELLNTMTVSRFFFSGAEVGLYGAIVTQIISMAVVTSVFNAGLFIGAGIGSAMY